MAVRSEGHWEQWIKFFLRGVSEVSLDASETARKILKLCLVIRSRDPTTFTPVQPIRHRGTGSRL
jgi:hypothetical protein